MMRIRIVMLVFLLFVAYFSGCKKEEVMPKDSLIDIPYRPLPFELHLPPGFPQMVIPADNPLTVDGVELGKRLFYDPIMSRDSTMSCFSCHMQENNFTDQLAVSPGVAGIDGRRSSMSLLNVGFNQNGFFWDGRAGTLEEQALAPVEDPIELDVPWNVVEERLRKHDSYPEYFRKAFGITSRNEISRDLAVKAIAQFERTIISSGTSKYDRIFQQKEFFTDEELMGYEMFFDLNHELPDAECGHCHNAPLFTINTFVNNGLDEVFDPQNFTDKGRGEVTGISFDQGRFRIPTLINIQYTAPYMHDGRFETLEQVLDHYNKGGHYADNRDPLIRPLGLTEAQKLAILAFLNTLVDTAFLQNPSFKNPFVQ